MTYPTLSSCDLRLRGSLATIYQVFATPTPAVIEGCPCCIEARGVDVLLTTPLRELTGQALSRYISGAFLTLGDQEDFRYLLPRILEVSVFDPGNAHFNEVVIGKLGLADWQSWSLIERQAVEELLDAWFERELLLDIAAANDGWMAARAESILCGAARAGLPLSSWLVRLNDPIAKPVLKDLKDRFPGELSAFWEDAPAGFREFSTILSQGRA